MYGKIVEPCKLRIRWVVVESSLTEGKDISIPREIPDKIMNEDRKCPIFTRA